MDYGGIVLEAHNLFARANSSSTSSSSHSATRPPIYKVVGIILAVCSGLFIGISFVLKKHGLLKANVKYNEEAGEGYGYLKNAFWWSGMTLMILGEVCNFVAYAFVDAILVTPLGALSVVVTTILSAIFLKERLSFVGKVGCFNCIIGSVVIVINAPAQSAVATIQDMKRLVIAPGFLAYTAVIVLGCLFIALWVAPRYGKKTMLVYLSICSLIGGLSVVCTQGLGAAIVSQISGTLQFNQWFLYVVLVFVVATLVTEIIYLNKALNLFNAALVTPTYYVFFTSATIVTSAILFQGFKGTAATIATVIMGFLQICSGVILLQLSKSAKDVPDTAVFKGDLDQVRTIAEQEEPEYEPRADTIRGGGSILRSISRMRSKRQLNEVKTLHEEALNPIAENEVVQWDGLRRRRTILDPASQTPTTTLQHARTLHPPLGMSRFPDPDPDDDDAANAAADDRSSTAETDFHPGIFPWHRRNRSSNAASPRRDSHPSVPLSPIKTDAKPRPTARKVSNSSDTPSPPPHSLGLPPALQRTRIPALDDSPVPAAVDTAYHGAAPPPPAVQHIHFSDEEARSKSAASSRTLVAARAAPQSQDARRQFSFQHVFGRRRGGSGGSGGGGGAGAEAADVEALRSGSGGSSGANASVAVRPGSGRSRLSFHRKNGGVGRVGTPTEEERLGLVRGDSRDLMAEGEEGEEEGGRPPGYEDVDKEWAVFEGEESAVARLGERERGVAARTLLPPLAFETSGSGSGSGSGSLGPIRYHDATLNDDDDDEDGNVTPRAEKGEFDAGSDESGRAFV